MITTPSLRISPKGAANEFNEAIETLVGAHYSRRHSSEFDRVWWIRENTRYTKNCHKVWKLDKYAAHPDCQYYVGEILSAVHPAILLALDTLGWPTNPRSSMLLESPHIPTNGDKGKVAYTMNEKHGVDDRQTVTTIGKYLTRQYPNAASHEIRDIAARFSSPEIQIWATTPEIIQAVEFGPRSCMQSGHGSIPFSQRYDYPKLEEWVKDKTAEEPDWDRHPYAVYDPAMGWSIAVIVERNGTIPNVISRCLLWQDPDDADTKVFVRSYKKSSSGDDGFSYASESIEVQLRELGWRRRSSWPAGAEMRRIEHPKCSGPLLPYLDGDSDYRCVQDTGRRIVKINHPRDVNSDHTVYQCDCTDGTGDEHDRYTWTCPGCDERMTDDDEDESLAVGRFEDTTVCNSCARNYSFVRGANTSRWGGNYREYYVHEDDAVEVLDERGHTAFYVDGDYIPPDVVQLYSGDYTELDNTVCIDDDYYMSNDPDVVELAEESPNGDNYGLRGDCWQDGNGDWHHDDHEYITYEGDRWMKDRAWECAGTGLWYPDFVDPEVDPMTGSDVHPEYLEGCNRDADFFIIYGDNTSNCMPHVLVNTGQVLIVDAVSSEVYALA